MRTRFGEFVLDSDARLIRRGAENVHLTAKALRLLEILLAGRPRAFSKEELLDQVWPDVVVSVENVKNLVAEIRAALGDGVIRTVHGFGYAFGIDAYEEAPAAAKAWIYYQAMALPLAAGETYVGRDHQCGICIDEPGVSRLHARIVLRNGVALLEDLGSKNGTHVGSRRIEEPVPLRDGDLIRVGSVSLIFRSRASTDVTVTGAAFDQDI